MEGPTYQQDERPQIGQLESLESHLLSFEQFSPPLYHVAIEPLVVLPDSLHSEGLKEAKRGKQFCYTLFDHHADWKTKGSNI